jgi:GntR family transcriptional regulator
MSANAAGGTVRGRVLRDTVEKKLRNLVTSEHVGEEGRLPTERELALQFGVSRTTIRQVLDKLEHAGLVVRRRGRTGGTFAVTPRVNLDFGQLAGIPSYLRAQGFRAGAHVVSARIVSAEPETVEALGLDKGALVHDIIRVRLADEVRISLEHTRIPVELFPDLLTNPLDDSLYGVIADKYGCTATRAIERMVAVAATEPQAEALGIDVGDPLMAIERVTYDQSGTPFEHSSDLFRGDRTRVIAWAHTTEEPPHVETGSESSDHALMRAPVGS